MTQEVREWLAANRRIFKLRENLKCLRLLMSHVRGDGGLSFSLSFSISLSLSHSLSEVSLSRPLTKLSVGRSRSQTKRGKVHQRGKSKALSLSLSLKWLCEVRLRLSLSLSEVVLRGPLTERQAGGGKQGQSVSEDFLQVSP